jgi:hypothetical protein
MKNIQIMTFLSFVSFGILSKSIKQIIILKWYHLHFNLFHQEYHQLTNVLENQLQFILLSEQELVKIIHDQAYHYHQYQLFEKLIPLNLSFF